MPRYRVLCKIGASKKRTEWADKTYSAKTPEEAIRKAKAENKAIDIKYPNKGAKYHFPRIHSWKAVKV